MGIPTESIKDPDVRLARLIETSTGLTVQPKAVRKLIVEHWRFIQQCAHQIHDEDVAERAIDAFRAEQKATKPAASVDSYGRLP